MSAVDWQSAECGSFQPWSASTTRGWAGDMGRDGVNRPSMGGAR